MLFILRRANAFGERVLLAHIGASFGVAVIVGVAEVVDLRPGVCPDNGAGGAMRQCRRFRRILVGAGPFFARALISIRQARATSTLWRRSSLLGWGRPSTLIATLIGSPRARISV